MNAKICDRCGSICSHGESYYAVIQTCRMHSIEVDLCNNCGKWILKEINKENEAKEEEE